MKRNKFNKVVAYWTITTVDASGNLNENDHQLHEMLIIVIFSHRIKKIMRNAEDFIEM